MSVCSGVTGIGKAQAPVIQSRDARARLNVYISHGSDLYSQYLHKGYIFIEALRGSLFSQFQFGLFIDVNLSSMNRRCYKFIFL